MIFNDAKTKGIKKEFGETEKIMESLGFDRWTWDYGKVTYDLQYTDNEKEYYLRLRGTVVNDKQLENPKALLEFGVPVFARHFFPHGLDESVEVPESLKGEVEAKIAELEKTLAS